MHAHNSEYAPAHQDKKYQYLNLIKMKKRHHHHVPLFPAKFIRTQYDFVHSRGGITAPQKTTRVLCLS